VRQIVSDTGPLLHLYEAASLNLLEHAGTITIPTAVDREMVQHVREWHTRLIQVTRHEMAGGYFAQGRLDFGTLGHSLGAAGVKTTAARRIDR
jgi:hypothetical protein